MKPRDVLHEVEPQPAAARLVSTGAAGLVETFENFAALPAVDADAVVDEVDPQLTVPDRKADIDLGRIGFVVFDGVDQQVHHEHFKQRAVDRIDIPLDVGFVHRNAAAFKQSGMRTIAFRDDRDQVAGFELRLIAFAFQACQIENPADVVRKPADVGQHVVDVLLLVPAGQVVFFEGFQKELQ